MRVRPIKLIAALSILAAFAAGCSPSATETSTTSSTSGNDSKTTSGASTSDTTTTPETTTSTTPDKAPDATAATTPDKSPDKVPATAPVGNTAAPGATMPKNGEQVAVMDTEVGRIVLKFFPDKAPRHVKNFITLANKKFYDGTKFHRTMPGFMIQGGDPNTKTSDRSTWGAGGPGYQIKGEMNDRHHTRGILSMARSQDPDSAGSQFFITVADVSSQLDPVKDSSGNPVPGREGYTVFGQVVQGMDVVDKIVNGPADGELAVNPIAIKKLRIEKWPIKK